MKTLSHRHPPLTLNPDGVRIFVDWWAMEPGMSVFIPAVHTQAVFAAVQRVRDATGYTLVARERVESGRLGVRVWRTT